MGDLKSARELASKLKDDKTFYGFISKKAQNNYEKFFKENVYKQNMKNIMESFDETN